jgi:hypothetical protein
MMSLTPESINHDVCWAALSKFTAKFDMNGVTVAMDTPENRTMLLPPGQDS